MKPFLVIYHANLREMSVAEKAYLAGLIDGEGYVGITRATASVPAKACKRGIAYRLLLSVRMTDRSPLDFAARCTGLGGVRKQAVPKGGFRVPWVWQLWSRQAAALLEAIRPYLLVKASQADVCIEFQRAMRMPGRNGLSDVEWALRESCWARTKELNYGRSA